MFHFTIGNKGTLKFNPKFRNIQGKMVVVHIPRKICCCLPLAGSKVYYWLVAVLVSLGIDVILTFIVFVLAFTIDFRMTSVFASSFSLEVWFRIFSSVAVIVVTVWVVRRRRERIFGYQYGVDQLWLFVTAVAVMTQVMLLCQYVFLFVDESNTTVVKEHEKTASEIAFIVMFCLQMISSMVAITVLIITWQLKFWIYLEEFVGEVVDDIEEEMD